MSSYTVIKQTGELLRDMLLQAFKDVPIIPAIQGNFNEIVFKNPTETARDPSQRLSLWLYEITENEYVKNQPRLRGNGGDKLRMNPLALNLYFLVTPFAASPEGDFLLLGKTMQVLYDNSIIPLPGPNGTYIEELHITLCRLSLEELTRIWEALREPYRLSVCYKVRVNRIESNRISTQARVIEQHDDYRDLSDREADG